MTGKTVRRIMKADSELNRTRSENMGFDTRSELEGAVREYTETFDDIFVAEDLAELEAFEPCDMPIMNELGSFAAELGVDL